MYLTTFSRYLLLLCLLLLESRAEYKVSEAWTKSMAKGKDRMDRIAAKHEDPNYQDETKALMCMINTWDVVQVKDPVDIKPKMQDISDKGGLGLSDKLYSIKTRYPREDVADGQFSATFGTLYDPKSGAIVFQSGDRDTKAKNQPTLTRADVSWVVYQAVVVADNNNLPSNGYNNLKTLLHTHVVSEDAGRKGEGIFNINNISFDRFFALFGLDTGATATGLQLSYWKAMGKKNITGAGVYQRGDEYVSPQPSMSLCRANVKADGRFGSNFVEAGRL